MSYRSKSGWQHALTQQCFCVAKFTVYGERLDVLVSVCVRRVIGQWAIGVNEHRVAEQQDMGHIILPAVVAVPLARRLKT